MTSDESEGQTTLMPTTEEAQPKKATRKSSQPKECVFLWNAWHKRRRVIVVEPAKDQVVMQGLIGDTVDRGVRIEVEFGVFFTEDKKLIEFLRNHNEFGSLNRERGFREVSERDELKRINELKDAGIPHERLAEQFVKEMKALEDRQAIIEGRA